MLPGPTVTKEEFMAAKDSYKGKQVGAGRVGAAG